MKTTTTPAKKTTTVKVTGGLVTTELQIPEALTPFFGKGAITLSVMDKALNIVEQSTHLNDCKKLLSFVVKEKGGAYYMSLLNEAQKSNSPFLPRLLHFNTEYLSRQTSDIRLSGFSPSKKTDKNTGLITWGFKPVSTQNEQKAKDKATALAYIQKMPQGETRAKLESMPKNSAADAAKFLEAARIANENLVDGKFLNEKAPVHNPETKGKVSPIISEGAHKVSINAGMSKDLTDKMYGIYQELMLDNDFSQAELVCLAQIIINENCEPQDIDVLLEMEFKKQA